MCNCVLLGAHPYHNAGEAAWLIEPLDGRVSAYIKRSVESGCTSPKELQSTVKEFVCNQIFFDINPPSTIRRRFYLSRRKIKNIFNSVKKEVRNSKIDQENLMGYTEKWRKNESIYFMPKYVDIEKGCLGYLAPGPLPSHPALGPHKMLTSLN